MHIWEKVDREFLIENGVQPPENISEKVKTLTITDASDYFISQFNLSLSQKQVIDRIEELVSDQYKFTINEKPFATELLDTLTEKGIKLCVATATYQSLCNVVLSRLGILPKFEFILTCSEVGEGKETPLVYIKSAELLGANIEDIVVVEDALHCAKTAKSAGFCVIGIYEETSANDWDEMKEICDYTVMSLSEIPKIIDMKMKVCEEVNG